jgi:uncharacterized protein YbjT (DUF2867 family)
MISRHSKPRQKVRMPFLLSPTVSRSVLLNPFSLKVLSTETLPDWEKASAAIEISQGKAIADAAVKAGVSLIIWSSLPRTGVAHFNSKADVEDYIRTLPIKSAFYMPGWFMQNFVHIMKPKKAYNGTYVMGKPWPTATSSSLIPLVDIEDTGKYIESFLEDPEKHNHVKLMAATGFYTPNEICETWSKVTGRNVVFDEEHDAVSGSTMTKEQREALTTSNVASESTYYGPGGEEGLEWTLTQMKEPPATWKSFVERHEPWFVDT